MDRESLWDRPKSIAPRMTRQRRIILEELRKVDTHPTADEIYTLVRRRLPHISLGTVYRNLDVLVANSEALCLDNAGSQKRFDGAVHRHSHVRCIKCGRVGDIQGIVPTPTTELLSAHGFEILSGHVEFEGLCIHCLAVD